MADREGARQPARMSFAEQTTPGGYRCDEAASALQKAIRRGLEAEALFWSSELDLAGFPGYVWKRLKIIASEDVGVASTETVLAVHALHGAWLELHRAKDSSGSLRLFLVHAVLLLARAPKNRTVDSAYVVFYEGMRAPFEIPDAALDRHTAAGRRLGRGWPHFFDHAAQLANEAGDDAYAAEGRRIRGA